MLSKPAHGWALVGLIRINHLETIDLCVQPQYFFLLKLQTTPGDMDFRRSHDHNSTQIGARTWHLTATQCQYSGAAHRMRPNHGQRVRVPPVGRDIHLGGSLF